MEIDVSIIILIIAIVGANLIVLVKIFYKDEEEEEQKEIQKEFPAVSKSWEEPMDDSQKKLLANDKNDLNNEIDREKSGLSSDKINNDNREIAIDNTGKYNEKIEEDNTGKELANKKSEYDVEVTKNNLEENEDVNNQKMKGKIANENSEMVEIIIEGKIYELTLQDNIIFTYNNENYSSYVLEIKHDNVKIKYRSQEKWINFSDIKKIL